MNERVRDHMHKVVVVWIVHHVMHDDTVRSLDSTVPACIVGVNGPENQSELCIECYRKI